jgi:Holliday junction resolvasome RuvABC endonuclease subunit
MAQPPFIFAMDIATRSGVCVGRPGEGPVFSTVKFHGGDRLQIAASALGWAARDLKGFAPEIAYLERPLAFAAAKGQSNANTLIRLNSLYDIVGGALLARGVRVVGVDVKDARQAFIGAGRLEREEAKRRCMIVCRMLGWAATNGDEADAAAVWYWGCCCEAPKIAAVVHPGMHVRAGSIAMGEKVVEAQGGR